MRTDLAESFTHLWEGIVCLVAMLQVGAFIVCVAHRRLSRRMGIVAAGFGGAGLTGIGYRLIPWVVPAGRADWLQGAYLAGGFLAFLSWSLIVIGLAAVFADLRRKLALAMEGSDARR